jgi:formate-dependent nitrite reductase membrane component NrfD
MEVKIMISPETQAPHWEWYYIAMYFYLGGVSAGAYLVGSLLELLGKERFQAISKAAYYIAFPLILVTPILLIADLGSPLRFWRLFSYMNTTSPLSVGTWALLVYGGMSFLSFVNILAIDGRLKSPGLTKFHAVFSRIPHKVYAAAGSFFGFFVAGYTGVLVNTTARPLWAATDPLIGPIFIVSAASTGAAAIVLFMMNQKTGTDETVGHLEAFDRMAMILEIALIVAMIAIAGRYAAPILTGFYGVLFLGGTVLLGILVPLWINWRGQKLVAAKTDPVMLSAILVLFGGLMLRISLVQAGQM